MCTHVWKEYIGLGTGAVYDYCDSCGIKRSDLTAQLNNDTPQALSITLPAGINPVSSMTPTVPGIKEAIQLEYDMFKKNALKLPDVCAMSNDMFSKLLIEIKSTNSLGISIQFSFIQFPEFIVELNMGASKGTWMWF